MVEGTAQCVALGGHTSLDGALLLMMDSLYGKTENAPDSVPLARPRTGGKTPDDGAPRRQGLVGAAGRR